jgi:predicted dehydrogenase
MGLADHGIHLLDCLPWLVGGRLESVYGRGNISGATQSTEFVQMAISGGAVGLLLYNDGAFYNDLPGNGVFSRGAAFEISGYVPPNRWSAHPGFIDIYGTRGSLKIFHYANLAFLTTGDGMEQLPLAGPSAPAHFTRQMLDFAAAVGAGQAAPVTGADGLAALQALHAVYESDRTGQRVTLPPVGAA